jgi:CspA family cold shock protein
MDSDQVRYRGTVKWFAKNKGYGFIEWREGGREVFVHFSAIARAGQRGLERGDVVEFSIRETPTGVQAARVIPLQPGALDAWGE